jgi:hypothetical protein
MHDRWRRRLIRMLAKRVQLNRKNSGRICRVCCDDEGNARVSSFLSDTYVHRRRLQRPNARVPYVS